MCAEVREYETLKKVSRISNYHIGGYLGGYVVVDRLYGLSGRLHQER